MAETRRPAKPARKKRWLKIVLLAVAALLIVALLGPTLLSTGPGRRLAAWYISQRVGGRAVTIDRLKVGYLSGFEVEKLVIGQHHNLWPEPYVTADRITYDGSLYSLLGSRGAPPTVLVEKLEVAVLRLPDGQLAGSGVAAPQAPAESAPARAPVMTAGLATVPPGGLLAQLAALLMGTAPAASTAAPAASAASSSAAATSNTATTVPGGSAAATAIRRFPSGDFGNPGTPGAPAAMAAKRTPIPVQIANGHVHYVDQKMGGEIIVTDLKVAATYDRGQIEISSAVGRLNGGTLALVGRLNHKLRPRPFNFDVRLAGCQVIGNMPGVGYQAPILYQPDPETSSRKLVGKTTGTLDLEASLRGRGFRREELHQSLQGTSNLRIRDLTIEGSESLRRMFDVRIFGGPTLRDTFKLRDSWTFDQLLASSTIADGRVASNLIRASRGEDLIITMSGYTDISGPIDYRIYLSGNKVRKYTSVLGEMFAIRLKGTLEDPKVGLGLDENGKSLKETLKGLIKGIK